MMNLADITIGGIKNQIMIDFWKHYQGVPTQHVTAAVLDPIILR